MRLTGGCFSDLFFLLSFYQSVTQSLRTVQYVAYESQVQFANYAEISLSFHCTFIIRPSYRHYASCPSVRAFVRLSVPYRHNSKTKKRRKIKIATNVSPGTSEWGANFQLKRSKVKITGRKNIPKSGFTFTYTSG